MDCIRKQLSVWRNLLLGALALFVLVGICNVTAYAAVYSYQPEEPAEGDIWLDGVDIPYTEDDGYVDLKGGPYDLCNNLNPNSSSGVNFQALCNNLENRTEITKLYLTTYYLNDPAEMSSAGGQQKVYLNHSNYFKDKVEAGGFDFDENFKDYVFYLPDFRYASPNGARFRLIAQFRRHTSTVAALDEPYYSYATIEVNREKGV